MGNKQPNDRKIEQVLIEKNVDAIVVYGDTNSTFVSL